MPCACGNSKLRRHGANASLEHEQEPPKETHGVTMAPPLFWMGEQEYETLKNDYPGIPCVEMYPLCHEHHVYIHHSPLFHQDKLYKALPAYPEVIARSKITTLPLLSSLNNNHSSEMYCPFIQTVASLKEIPKDTEIFTKEVNSCEDLNPEHVYIFCHRQEKTIVPGPISYFEPNRTFPYDSSTLDLV